MLCHPPARLLFACWFLLSVRRWNLGFPHKMQENFGTVSHAPGTLLVSSQPPPYPLPSPVGNPSVHFLRPPEPESPQYPPVLSMAVFRIFQSTLLHLWCLSDSSQALPPIKTHLHSGSFLWQLLSMPAAPIFLLLYQILKFFHFSL